MVLRAFVGNNPITHNDPKGTERPFNPSNCDWSIFSGMSRQPMKFLGTLISEPELSTFRLGPDSVKRLPPYDLTPQFVPRVIEPERPLLECGGA